MADFVALIQWADSLLGLDLHRTTTLVIPEDIQKLLDQREEARTMKDWKMSDELRAKIEAKGFEVKDSPSGSKVTRRLDIGE
jgi:cysteinyl-tRNA synthetase